MTRSLGGAAARITLGALIALAVAVLTLSDAAGLDLTPGGAARMPTDAGPGAALADLPIVELPPARKPEALAVILSGDGGWRDLDKVIGEDLAAGPFAVIGLDSLRYFWSVKDAQTIARDLERILRHYGEAWDADRVILVGYSFGAGVLPATIRHLPTDLQSRVDLVVLLAPQEHADFEIRVAGWAGVKSAGQAVLPDAVELDPRKLMCVYGDEDEESLCVNPALHDVERVRTGGGHHFDGDYPRLAELIRHGFESRRPR